MFIGNEKIIEDLRARAAKDALPHGFVFTGPAMTGKRTAALAFAHFLERDVFEPLSPGVILQDAKVIDHAFMKLIDPEASGNAIGIDAARAIKNFLWQRPNTSARRTLIVDDAAMMTNEAQNAILKITEEPPASSLLILVASDADGILPTILSRLQKISFGTVPESAIAGWISKAYGAAPAKAAAAAKQSRGKPGLAWRLLFDETLVANIARAESFLKAAPAARRDAVKKIIEPDDFNMRVFLDALILVLARNGVPKAKIALWHKTLALRGRIADFALNPRLQLENLLN